MKDDAYVISTDLMAKILSSTNDFEFESLHRFAVMVKEYEDSIPVRIPEGVAELKEDDPRVIEAMGELGSIIAFGSIRLRKLFNRIFSLLPPPEKIDAWPEDKPTVFKVKRHKEE